MWKRNEISSEQFLWKASKMETERKRFVQFWGALQETRSGEG